MTQETKPTHLIPQYAEDRVDNITDPTIAVRKAGIDVGADAVSNNWNWVLWNISRWIQWIDFRSRTHIHGGVGDLGAPKVSITSGVDLGTTATIGVVEVAAVSHKLVQSDGALKTIYEVDESLVHEVVIKNATEAESATIGVEEDNAATAVVVGGLAYYGIQTGAIQVEGSLPSGLEKVVYDKTVLAKENVVKSIMLYELTGESAATLSNYLRGFGSDPAENIIIATNGAMVLDFPSIDGVSHFATVQVRNTGGLGARRLMATAYWSADKIHLEVIGEDSVGGEWKTMGATGNHKVDEVYELTITVT